MSTTSTSKVDQYRNHERSFFISLTLPNFEGEEERIREACDGAQLVEFRVDLLAKHENLNEFQKYVEKQFEVLRSCTKLDILYTVRTKAQGGAWPDNEINGLLGLYDLGLRLGVEFLDVEMQLEPAMIESIVARKGSTSIIASHHDWSGNLSWADGGWIPWYEKAAKYGDVVKLVGTAKKLNDNIALENFRARVSRPSDKPLVAINMGAVGQMSRILNPFMTPVSHPALASKAAPGQLSVAEIRQAMVLMGLASEQ